MAITMKISLI